MAKRQVKRSFDLYSAFTFFVPGIKGLLMLLVMFLVGVLIGNFVSAVILLCFSNSPQELVNAAATVVGYPVMFIPPMIYASYQSRKNQFFGVGYELDSNNFFPFSGFSIALAVSVATIAMAFVMDIFNAIMPPMPQSLQKTMEMMMNGPLWMTLLSVSVFAPLFEEWLCRGMILRGLLQKISPVWAIVVSAAVFALIHMNPWQAIPAFGFGLLFGYVYYRTGSLKLTMLMHCVNNTFSVIVGKMDDFKDIESFMDVMSTSSYLLLILLCILMLVYFVVRIQKVQIPYGQKSGCYEVHAIEDDVAAGE